MTTPDNTPQRRDPRRVIGAVALSAIAALSIGVATASAATIPTNISIQRVERPARDVFKGFVTAPDSRCFENRRVLLFRVTPGPDTRLDSDRSEDNGSWSIDVEGGAPSGSYYAKAPRKAVGADICAAAKSSTVTVP